MIGEGTAELLVGGDAGGQIDVLVVSDKESVSLVVEDGGAVEEDLGAIEKV